MFLFFFVFSKENSYSFFFIIVYEDVPFRKPKNPSKPLSYKAQQEKDAAEAAKAAGDGGGGGGVGSRAGGTRDRWGGKKAKVKSSAPAQRTSSWGGAQAGARAGVCYNYQKGACDRGDACRFSHEDEAGSRSGGQGGAKAGVCYSYQKGACDRGDNCRFSHEGEAGSRRSGYGARAGVCYDNQRGACNKGDSCRFSHEGEAGSGRQGSSYGTRQPTRNTWKGHDFEEASPRDAGPGGFKKAPKAEPAAASAESSSRDSGGGADLLAGLKKAKGKSEFNFATTDTYRHKIY